MNFSDNLISWYFQHKRNLPWRNTTDVYLIWVSEVILQQTRVEQGLEYYERIVAKYPDIFSLAAAREEDLLKLWQGLGYYTRARNLLRAAKEIVADYDGVFPQSYDQVIKIRGIGKYTASAVLSFAYNMPYPVMDGNVKRVLSRYFGLNGDIAYAATNKVLESKLQKVFDKKRPSDFNQAIMEFGALQCKVNNPECEKCPLKDGCRAFKEDMVAVLPVKSKRTSVKTRYFYYLVPWQKLRGQKYTFLQRRETQDIWKHLFQFPLIETAKKFSWNRIAASAEFKDFLKNNPYEVLAISPVYSHKLSHQTIYAVFVQLEVFSVLSGEKLFKVSAKNLKNYPTSRLIEKYLDEHVFADI
ncbi:MAG TPA: A/G-specific adenine glycosylase [Bacteroidales bacterium]|nr:A/G-specific adenine glycosylase [Bacteroidales bacterium]